MISAVKVNAGYEGKKVLNDISLSISKGKMTGIIGPNGSGKTTLMKVLNGTHPMNGGEVLIKGKRLQDYSAKELARVIAVLPQHAESSFDFTVREVVELGRYPFYKGLLKAASAYDEQVVNEAMELTGVQGFAHKNINQLSGGEQQRVMLAKALAQEPEILLLDEPTNHLDLSYQMKLMDLLKKWIFSKELTVVAILHDLNIASLYCDEIILLDEGSVKADGQPRAIMNQDLLQDVYDTNLTRQEHPSTPSPLIAPVPEMDAQEKTIQSIELTASKELMVFSSPFPLKTLSSALIGGGFQWASTFVNRHVDKNYYIDDAHNEYKDYLQQRQFDPHDTIGMMTAARLEDAGVVSIQEKDFSLLIAATAGTGNAVDAAQSWIRKEEDVTIGTINIWIFIESKLTDEAFVQAMMTATEAKSSALREHEVLDPVTKTMATGTSTDSLCIASTQSGTHTMYAGTITLLGKAIGKGVYEAIGQAIENYRKRMALC
ncbi:heme ABC transporter ATP-binding protein [Fictibacillus barbaricus]|uniref:Heme ABC transporter ATP-binding protein n=1 Tax=Fictibacillus barbaricus TaxID=182136 RepID=A0ABS2ZB50_9BACL|nr:heme ABC transporter ATP-binding protein [Fictibacillus barbaricus]MBN3544966.1 heme ABC transporter ATP-binding protein [Fictibacillus barbaricus]GGB62726.1 putative ABC transporter ATP-binding protein YvrA [Fictibacillus barbaricus]